MSEPSSGNPLPDPGSKPENPRVEVGDPLPYAYEAPSEAEPEAVPVRPKAVFVAHGMGQQAPFATLDQLAAGLRRADARRRGIPETEIDELPPPTAREVVLGGTGDERGERLGRVELKLARNGGGDQEVHLYEGYWAYLTEGKVALRNVVGFMFRTGVGGVRHAMKEFPRWLFGKQRKFPAEIRTVVYFLIGLGVVSSLIEINTAIVAVAAARAPFSTPPDWLSPGLFLDLTTTFNMLLAVYAALGLTIGGSAGLRRLDRWIASRVRPAGRLAAECRPYRAPGIRPLRKAALVASATLFYLTLLATIAAGVAVPALLYLHGQSEAEAESTGDVRVGAIPPDRELILREPAPAEGRPAAAEAEAPRECWKEWLGEPFVGGFNERWDSTLAWLGSRAAILLLAVSIVLFLYGLVRSLLNRNQTAGQRWWTATTVLALIVVGGAVAAVAYGFGRACGVQDPIAATRRGLSWPLLILLSAWIRSLLVQYVGDVVIYVDAHVLDRFHQAREEICNRVQRKARAVYAAIESAGRLAYDEISIVGHSLGSVLLYDVLNRLTTDEELARSSHRGQGDAEGPLGVVGRTRLLLTFGSPLDKVAFLFGLRAAQGMVARELINAWRQPLIREARFRRFRWLNVYAPADIFSGRLDYYDPPRTESTLEEDLPPRVVNVKDDDALTLLAAHQEYWTGPEVFKALHDELGGWPLEPRHMGAAAGR